MGFAFRRLLRALPAILVVVMLSFAMIHLAPGDAVDALAGEGGDQATYEYLRSYLGLDEPLWRQFLTYIGNLARGDLGVSFVQGGTPVAELIGQRLTATLLLVFSAMTLSAVGGVLLGALAASRPFGALDFSINSAALVSYAVPAFWLGQLALMAFAFGNGWFPVQGMTQARVELTGLGYWLDVAHHLVLPALVLASSQLALIVRVTRVGLLEEMSQDYVTTARAKAVPKRRIMLRHALPNALLPVVTIIGTRVGLLFTITLVTEIVFGWPGLGSLLLTASQSRDRPVILGLVIIISVSVVVANLITDLVYAWIDPRIRYE